MEPTSIPKNSLSRVKIRQSSGLPSWHDPSRSCLLLGEPSFEVAWVGNTSANTLTQPAGSVALHKSPLTKLLSKAILLLKKEFNRRSQRMITGGLSKPSVNLSKFKFYSSKASVVPNPRSQRLPTFGWLTPPPNSQPPIPALNQIHVCCE